MIPTKRELLRSLIGKKVEMFGETDNRTILKYDSQRRRGYIVINEVGGEMIEYTPYGVDGAPGKNIYLSMDGITMIEKM